MEGLLGVHFELLYLEFACLRGEAVVFNAEGDPELSSLVFFGTCFDSRDVRPVLCAEDAVARA